MSGVGAIRVGDVSTGHGCWPPTTAAVGSVTSFTDQLPQVRMTDAYVLHCCPGPPGCHPVMAAQGSQTAFTDQLASHCVGHALSCGDIAAIGSLTSFKGK
jgi:hypothetical protein